MQRENSIEQPEQEEDDRDEIAEIVSSEKIRATCTKIDFRPDVVLEEQQRWQKQDPDYPLEHYRCLLTRGNRELLVYQTIGADYPDEDEEEAQTDLYQDSRDLLLSPEFLLESAALKANSIDEASTVDEWVANGYCETDTPNETYQHYLSMRQGLNELLGDDLYRIVIRLAVEAEIERDEESEE